MSDFNGCLGLLGRTRSWWRRVEGKSVSLDHKEKKRRKRRQVRRAMDGPQRIAAKRKQQAADRVRKKSLHTHVASPREKVLLRYTRFRGGIPESERDRIGKHPMHKLGDMVLVWVNKGDLTTLEMNGLATKVKTEPAP